jgi:hypothetical protein
MVQRCFSFPAARSRSLLALACLDLFMPSFFLRASLLAVGFLASSHLFLAASMCIINIYVRLLRPLRQG